MATILYRNAILLIDGVDLSTQLTELGVVYKAEMLDETTMGDDTRVHKGGLKDASISGKGLMEFGEASRIGDLLWTDVGTDDIIVAAFPDGITEGGQYVGSGYAMKGVVETMTFGGPVGAMLTVDFAVQGRGAEA